jgi:ribosomal 50S subunit-associated protein YjgA (DUF615 family)
MGTAHQQHLQQSKLYHRLPQEKSEYCQQISQMLALVINLYHSKDHQEIVTLCHSAFHHAEHPYGRNHSIQEPPRIGML